jgi:hypothetical protein
MQAAAVIFQLVQTEQNNFKTTHALIGSSFQRPSAFPEKAPVVGSFSFSLTSVNTSYLCTSDGSDSLLVSSSAHLSSRGSAGLELACVQ